MAKGKPAPPEMQRLAVGGLRFGAERNPVMPEHQQYAPLATPEEGGGELGARLGRIERELVELRQLVERIDRRHSHLD